jgi:hypothetical protein
MQSLFESLTKDLKLSHYDDWLTFDGRLEELIRSGRARRVPSLRTLHMPDEEWYLNPSSGEVYVYVRPDDKILPAWEPADVFAEPKEEPTCKTGLDAIPIRKMSHSQVVSLKELLNFLVRHGIAEVLNRPKADSATLPGGAETWYRDLQTEVVYRLVENVEDDNSRWERVALEQKEMATQ